jgi:hypothetical protein
MPKIIVHSPVGTFDAAQRHSVAAELTDFAIECEALPASPFVKSTVWTYFNEYAADACAIGAYAPSTITRRLVEVMTHKSPGLSHQPGRRRRSRGTRFLSSTASSCRCSCAKCTTTRAGKVRGADTDLSGIRGESIARADVARFVVDQLTEDRWLHHAPLIRQ